MTTKFDDKVAELSDQLKAELGDIDLKAEKYTLADAIREGSRVTTQAFNWGNGNSACALSAAAVGARARGHL